MRPILELLARILISTISLGFTFLGISLAFNPAQFQIISSPMPLPSFLITVELVLEYLPAFAVLCAAIGGYYAGLTKWEKPKIENWNPKEEAEKERLKGV